MDDTRYRWVIVAAGGLLGCVAIGAMFSLPVFLRPIAQDTGWSITGVSSAMTVAFVAMAVGSIAWGNLSDRFGPRFVVLAGSLLLSVSLALASQMRSLLAFQLVFGVFVGISTAAIFAPMMACVTGWFDTRRSLAVSLVSAGMGMAPMTMSPFAAWLVSHYDWRTAMAVIGCLAWALLIPAALLVRQPPRTDHSTAAPAMNAGKPAPRAVTALLSVQFIVLGMTFFLCCAAHSGPLFHFVSYAVSCGVPLMAAVSIYSVEGLAGLGGRLLLGVAADRLGVKPVLIGGLFVQSLAILGYMFADRQSEFYLLGIVFGTAYSGVMPLYAVLAREYFDQRIMGTLFGAAIMLSSLGMALGPVVGGWIFDTYHDYRWLYLSSTAIALAATAVAFAFPPLPRTQPEAVAT
jgi:MFS family permease